MLRRILLLLMIAAAAFIGLDIYRLASLRGGLMHVDRKYAYGPDKADLVVTEFLDYGCVYCRQVHPAIMEAVRRDGGILYAPRPLALSDDTKRATQLAFAAGLQGKFAEIHAALMENYRALDDALLGELAEKAGLDKDRLIRDMAGGKVNSMLEKNAGLFAKLRGREIPMFVVGRKMVYVPRDRLPETQDFLAMFRKARAGEWK